MDAIYDHIYPKCQNCYYRDRYKFSPMVRDKLDNYPAFDDELPGYVMDGSVTCNYCRRIHNLSGIYVP